MKRTTYAAATLLVAMSFLASLPLAASSSRQDRELKVMTGILETTLGFVERGGSGPELAGFGGSDVRGFRLPEQGVVFIISLRRQLSWPRELLEVEAVAPGAPVADTSPAVTAERVQDLRVALKREQERAKERIANETERVEEIKRLLIEAVADYGNSLTTLDDDAFVNLVLLRPEGFAPVAVFEMPGRVPGGDSAETEVLAIRRSEIRSYQAGTLSLADLTRRVLSR